MPSFTILLLEPFFSGSHAQWAKGFQQFSQHHVEILSLPGRHWKWRMFGGAVSLAQQWPTDLDIDLVVASDMLDLTTLVALRRRELQGIPLAIYFHENQITYPWSPTDQDVQLERHNEYGFINFTSALAADRLFFNSEFHRQSFLEALPGFLKQFPDRRHLDLVSQIADKSEVLYLGLDLQQFNAFRETASAGPPIILWNHRWEYDKHPEAFYRLLLRLRAEGLPFRLVVLGESYAKSPIIFKKIETEFKTELLHFGFAPDFETYARWLWQAQVLPVTNVQDFFGGSIVEAMYCRTWPILPNRLAYPEHLAANMKAECLYDSEEDLFQKTKAALSNPPPAEQLDQLQNLVARYDWSTLAAYYDDTLSKLIQREH